MMKGKSNLAIGSFNNFRTVFIQFYSTSWFKDRKYYNVLDFWLFLKMIINLKRIYINLFKTFEFSRYVYTLPITCIMIHYRNHVNIDSVPNNLL